MQGVENILIRGEKFLNAFDKIPFASTLSATVRASASIVQIIAGAAFGFLKALLSPAYHRKAELQNGMYFSLHGIGNLIRAAFAFLPGVNLILVAYDSSARMNYFNESLDLNQVYPLMKNRHISLQTQT